MKKKLLTQIDPNLGRYETPAGTYDPGETIGSTGATTEQFISNAVGFLTGLAGVMFLIYFFIGALTWVMAGSDEGKVENAKKQMTNGAIGLVIVVLSYGIISVLGNFVGIRILNPAETLEMIGPASQTGGGGGAGGGGNFLERP